MLKKLVAGTLVAGFALTGGLGAVSAEEKSNTIKSFDYLKVDEQNVNSFAKLSEQDKKISKLLWYYQSKMKMEIG